MSIDSSVAGTEAQAMVDGKEDDEGAGADDATGEAPWGKVLREVLAASGLESKTTEAITTLALMGVSLWRCAREEGQEAAAECEAKLAELRLAAEREERRRVEAFVRLEDERTRMKDENDRLFAQCCERQQHLNSLEDQIHASEASRAAEFERQLAASLAVDRLNFAEATKRCQRVFLARALEEANYRLDTAAKRLGLTPAKTRRLVTEHGLIAEKTLWR